MLFKQQNDVVVDRPLICLLFKSDVQIKIGFTCYLSMRVTLSCSCRPKCHRIVFESWVKFEYWNHILDVPQLSNCKKSNKQYDAVMEKLLWLTHLDTDPHYSYDNQRVETFVPQSGITYCLSIYWKVYQFWQCHIYNRVGIYQNSKQTYFAYMKIKGWRNFWWVSY